MKTQTAEEMLKTELDFNYEKSEDIGAILTIKSIILNLMRKFASQQAMALLHWYRNEPFENTMNKSEEQLLAIFREWQQKQI